jgi:hypothetical protein
MVTVHSGKRYQRIGGGSNVTQMLGVDFKPRAFDSVLVREAVRGGGTWKRERQITGRPLIVVFATISCQSV